MVNNRIQLINQEQELKNCTEVKTLLMLIIVLYHSMIIFVGDGAWAPVTRVVNAPAFGCIANWLNSFHIYAFTLISGYVFCYVKYERGGYKKYISFLRNKALRLLLPYGFIVVVWAMPVYIHFWGTDEVVEKFILGVAPGQLWFLLMLFWVFAIFWPLSGLTRRKPLLCGIIVCVLYVLGIFSPDYFCFYRGLQYIIYFYAGFIIRSFNLTSKLYKIPSIVYLLVDILLYILCYTIDGGANPLFKIVNMGINILTHLFGAVSAFVLLQRLVTYFIQDNKVIKYLSKHTMTVYLVHQQILYYVISWINGFVSPIVMVLINFIFALVLSLMISVLMQKTRITRILVGNK